MVCEKRPYLCAVLVLCSFALLFHLAGFVTPGWLIMRRSVGDPSLFQMKGQRIDDGGVIAPEPEDEPKPVFRRRRSYDDDDDFTSDDDDDREGHPDGHQRPPHDGHHDGHHIPPHDGHHGRPHHGSDGPHHDGDRRHHESSSGDDDFGKGDKGMMKEKFDVESWMLKAVSEIESFEVRTSFGLWYSVMCIHAKRNGGDHDSDEKHMERMDDDSSSSSSDDDDRKGRHHCKRMSTKCALSYATIYEDYMYFSRHDRLLSYKNFGNASLKEHQIENSVVLACMVLGLISAIVGFKNANGCRCARLACVVFMLLAAFIAIVPVARLGHYSANRSHQKSMIKVHAPLSAISTLIGAIFAFVSAIVAGYALYKTRRNQAGKWYQFNNELEKPNQKEKPALYYSTDPLPAKPGLYDVCDFSNIKPVEEIKKPEMKEEEPDEFVL